MAALSPRRCDTEAVEGGGSFDNLVKCFAGTVPTNFGEGLVGRVAMVAGPQLPILPVHLLWSNLTVAVLRGSMLAFAPKEEGGMERPPRDPGQRLCTRELAFAICLDGFLPLMGTSIRTSPQRRSASRPSLCGQCRCLWRAVRSLQWPFTAKALPSSRSVRQSRVCGRRSLDDRPGVLVYPCPMMQPRWSCTQGGWCWPTPRWSLRSSRGGKMWKNGQSAWRQP